MNAEQWTAQIDECSLAGALMTAGFPQSGQEGSSVVGILAGMEAPRVVCQRV